MDEIGFMKKELISFIETIQGWKRLKNEIF